VHTKELFDLTGRVAIVTGGSIGLGYEMSVALAEMGANIVIADITEDTAKKASQELEALRVNSLALKCDITKPDEVEALVEATVEKFGSIDILVNNAGISWAESAETMALKNWQKVMSVNIDGMFIVTQKVGQVMIKQQRGKIINIASVAGFVGCDPDVVNTIAYNTSKGAVISFTRDLACKWVRHNITVNGIAPGWVPTHMSGGLLDMRREELLRTIPMQRFGNASELRGAVVFLASDASSYVTGQTLVVDGGITAW
jgi:gluconate 5-dehydrogenase